MSKLAQERERQRYSQKDEVDDHLRKGEKLENLMITED